MYKELPAFPFIFQFNNGDQYVVVSKCESNSLTMVVLKNCADAALGTVYADNISEGCLLGALNEERPELRAKVLSPVEDSPLTLKLEVDASPLESALATAKELEATLLRIKGSL